MKNKEEPDKSGVGNDVGAWGYAAGDAGQLRAMMSCLRYIRAHGGRDTREAV